MSTRGREYYTHTLIDQLEALTRRVKVLEEAQRPPASDPLMSATGGGTGALPPALLLVDEVTGQWYRLACLSGSDEWPRLWLRPVSPLGEVA